MAAVNAFTASLAPRLEGSSRFRFVYLSGMIAERDQSKKLWFGPGSQKWKVRANRQDFMFAQKSLSISTCTVVLTRCVRASLKMGLQNSAQGVRTYFRRSYADPDSSCRQYSSTELLDNLEQVYQGRRAGCIHGFRCAWWQHDPDH